MISPISRKHPVYTDDNGITYPSVTQILSIVNKPYLVNWANNLGLKGVAVQDASKESTDVGTLTHAFIEGHITREEVSTDGYNRGTVDQALLCYEGYLIWEEKYHPTYVETEKSFISKEHGYAGTIDAVCKIGDQQYILDWKTSASIYPEYVSQVVAYRLGMGKTGTGWGDSGNGCHVGVVRLFKDSTSPGYQFARFRSSILTLHALDFFMECKKLWNEKVKMESAWKQAQKDGFDGD